MLFNRRGEILQRTGFVWIVAIALGLAWSAAIEAAPAKPAKPPSTQQEGKLDQSEWKKIVEAAKKEGKIVLSGAPGEEWRKALVDMFQHDYPEITVEFTAGPGRNFWPRIRQEREMGKKLWDLRSGGIDPMTYDAKRDGFLAPLRSVLLPEIADDSKWIGGIDGSFQDREKKYIFGYSLYIEPSAYVNRDFIKESDLKSTDQLLDPKFKGKIVILTPTGGASMQSLGNLAYMYGKDFVRDLFAKQDMIITDDNRQQVEWVVRGKYPISVGFMRAMLITFEKQGLGKNVVKLEDKITRLTTGFGTLSLIEGAPHPNAAKVYINWLLSQKTQNMMAQTIKHNSARLDVPPVEAAVDPAKFSQYRISSVEEHSEFDGTIVSLIKEVLKH